MSIAYYKHRVNEIHIFVHLGF